MTSVGIVNNIIVYKGSNYLRQRLLLSTLSGKPVRIIEIRHLDDEPGLREYEINLVRLLDKITNGTTIEVSETGTALYYNPGLLQGGKIDHECSTERGIGYYLEILLCVGPFCKLPINATLRGVTNNNIDVSVDHFKTAAISILKRFLKVDDGLEFKITKRGMPPLGGGEIIFHCPVKKNLFPIQFSDYGMVKRIRGTVYTLRVSPAIANRIVETAKGVMLNFLPDVYINTDHCKGKQAGKSPGFGINLVAETTSGVIYCAEQVSKEVSEGENEPSIPEDLGTDCAQRLLEEIYRGGCCDSAFQSVVALFMALGQKDVSTFVVGPLSQYTISFLRHLKEFFGVTFKLEHLKPDSEDDMIPGADKIVLTCVGVGYLNLSKRVL